ncbi:solute carrier organic anion transporter family member 4A1 [Dermacentor silvarum]|uniref:solute carrier organic anion transporter family member 4A1 n=1 Tax=Dermacentor silvarum TaxID=543639 RepID=UPI0021015C33|nr:solute carrier organic anion transporter family member 4A1 [Dermacentor silvarum]
MCFAVALPVSFLPAELPDHAVVMAEKKLEDQDKPLSQNEGNLRATVLHLLSIKPFVLVCFAGSAELMVASGLSSFLVKMLQAQFSMTASTASMIMGSVTIPTAMVGVMLGGVVISRFQLAAAGIVRLCVLVLLVPIVLVTVLLFHCDNIPYRNVQYDVGGVSADHASLPAYVFLHYLSSLAYNIHS